MHGSVSNKKVLLIILAIFLIPLVALITVVMIAWPELKKAKVSSANLQNYWLKDDVTHLKTLDSRCFRCSYPANWSHTLDNSSDHAEQDLKPIGGSFVTMYEYPEDSESEQEVFLNVTMNGMKAISKVTEEEDVRRWGRNACTGKSIHWHLLMQSYEDRFVRIKYGNNGAAILIHRHRSDPDRNQQGFDAIEKSFEVKPDRSVARPDNKSDEKSPME